MTDEQNERAARVWREACGAYEDNSHDLTLSIRDRTIAGDQAAAAIIAADRAELVERVKVLEGVLADMLHAVCHETGFAAAVRADSGLAYPWEPLDMAEAKARAALKDTSHDRRS